MSDLFEISIVIPCFNEAARLPRTLEILEQQIGDGSLSPVIVQEVIIVDDGSKDATVEVARGFSSRLPGLSVVVSEKNYGKGHAVHEGLNRVKSRWGLVADADMSTPWPEMAKLAKRAAASKSPIAIGSRDVVGSEIMVHQSFIREHLGKSFNVFVRFLTGLPFKDTQCGFKLAETAKISAFLPKLEINRFAWDVEFLMFAREHGLAIQEVAVRWEHREESRVHPIRDGLQMLSSVIALRFRFLLGRLGRLGLKVG